MALYGMSATRALVRLGEDQVFLETFNGHSV